MTVTDRRRARRRPIAGLAAGILAAATAIGVGTAATASAPPAEGGTFTTILGADPGVLDPHLSAFSATANALAFAYDTLLYPSPDREGLVGGLAESWEETATSVSYTLREGITCGDGSPLTATTVADNFLFVADPANQSPLLGVHVPPGITAAADDAARTVTLSSEAPVPFFLRSTGLGLYIVCANGLADRSILADGTDGTGPFVLADAVPNDRYTFTARDGYAWGPDGMTTDAAGFPSTVEIRIVPNESTAVNLLLSGDANTVTVSGPDRQRLESEGLFTVENRAIIGEFMFNHAEGLPTADVAVRQALMRSLDLLELMAVQTGGTGIASEGLVSVNPKACPGDTVGEILAAGADLEAAGALLDEAGWAMADDGVRAKDGQRLTIRAVYVTEFDNSPLTMEVVLEAWQELGVEVELQGADQAQFNTIAFETGAWDVTLAAVNLNLPSQLVPFVSGPAPADGGVNFSSIANAEYEALVGEAMALTGDEACAQWNAAEEALYAQMNILPFADSTLPTFAQGAEFQMAQFGFIPATIRLTES